MKYNKLGQSNMLISEVGFGCMSLKAENESLIHRAIETGITYFDTADLYDFGQNEMLIGTALRGKREKVVLATKVGNKWQADKSGWSWDVSKAYINKSIDDSLQRLRTDYVDIYQIHGGTIEDDFDEVVETLENLVFKGKIRAYGISSIRPNVFLRFAKESDIASNMMQYSLLDTRPESYLSTLHNANVSVLARGAFAQGLLVGKPIRQYLDHEIAQVAEIIRQVEELAAELNVSKEAIALGYLLRFKRITSAIVGIRTSEQMDKLLSALRQLEGLQIDFDSLHIPKIFYQAHLQ